MSKLQSSETTSFYKRSCYLVKGRSEAIKLAKKHGFYLDKRGFLRPMDKSQGSPTGYYGRHSTEDSKFGFQMLFIWDYRV